MQEGSVKPRIISYAPIDVSYNFSWDPGLTPDSSREHRVAGVVDMVLDPTRGIFQKFTVQGPQCSPEFYNLLLLTCQCCQA